MNKLTETPFYHAFAICVGCLLVRSNERTQKQMQNMELHRLTT